MGMDVEKPIECFEAHGG